MKCIVEQLATEYQDEGGGPCILMLHGWQDQLHTFDAITGILTRTHRVVRLDLPGFGSTERPKEVWGVDEYVQFVADFITKLDLHVDVLIGHSFGGRIAIKGIATKHLQPRTLVLIASAGIAKRRTIRHTALGVVAKVGRAATSIPGISRWKKTLRRRLYGAIGSDYFRTGPLRETFLKVISEDLSGSAREITTPTLLIWGAHDTATPVTEGQQLSQLIPHARLTVLPNVGHFVHQEYPSEVSTYIMDFI
jgi:pimeloyl-ACP methyl ester carboxylesterase